jgi:hypothetical protein
MIMGQNEYSWRIKWPLQKYFSKNLEIPFTMDVKASGRAHWKDNRLGRSGLESFICHQTHPLRSFFFGI